MKTPDFELVSVDGKRYGPVAARGDNGLLVMFICNHCPYVKAVLERIVRDCKALAARPGAQRPARAVRGHGADRRNRRRAEGAASLDGLLDQVEKIGL